MGNFETLPFWPFLIVVFSATAALFLRAIRPSSWNLILRSTYSSRALSQLSRDEGAMENGLSATMVFAFFLSIALAIFAVRDVFPVQTVIPARFPLYLLTLFVLFFVYISKVALLYLLQFIFDAKEIFNEYIILFLNINIVLGITLLPLLTLHYYNRSVSDEWLFGIGAGLAGLALIARYIRIFEIGLRYQMKWYNIILYLCTLEIIPLILIMASLENVGINLNLG